MPVVVTLPAEIDFTNAEEASDQIRAGFRPGVTVVIADLTTTIFCDSPGIRHLLLAHERASASGLELRFAVPATSPVRRILKLTGVNRVLAVYPSLDEAIIGGPSSAEAGPGKHAIGEPPAHPLST